jgi:hypothetical protein
MPARRGWVRSAIVVAVVLAGIVAIRRSVGHGRASTVVTIEEAPVARGERRGEAIVLIDSRQPDVDDFERLISPYLTHFGLPFAVVDRATTGAAVDVGAYSLVVIGHRGVLAKMEPAARAGLDAAVDAGVGLVTFDGDLWDGAAPRLQGVGALAAPASEMVNATTVSFVDPAVVRTLVLADDAGQRPVVATLSPGSAVDTADGQWSERSSRDAEPATVLAGIDEPERHGLPPMRFAAADVPAGDYDVVAELYTGPAQSDLRYRFGFGDEAPDTRHVDAVGGSGGTREHTEYWLGRVTVGSTGFVMHIHDADALRGTAAVFGWRQVRLVPAAAGAGPPP